MIPLVVHHGKHRWASPVQLLDVIDLDPAAKEAAQPYLPRFEFLLDDLHGIDDRQLQDRHLTPPAEITLVLLRDAPGNPEIVAGLRPRSGKLRAVLDQPSVDDKSRKLIGSCTDLGILNGWFRRAFKVDKASDLFEE